jgi:ligand-binding SRPBCC domain-containing protein
MARIELVTEIRARPERCFDLARDIGLHLRCWPRARERVVGGRSEGLIGPGEEVVWRARHFGMWHEHHARITDYDRPRRFRDTMVRGTFASYHHDHAFAAIAGGTRMTDVVEFRSRFGLLGLLAERAFLVRWFTRLLRQRNELLRREAEAEEAAAERRTAARGDE